MKAVVNERVLEAAVKEGAKTGTHLKQLESCQLPFQTKTNPAVQYEVTFAKTSRTIQTLEGKAHCEAGDAIITGVIGEQWPVQAADFPRKFFPGEGQAAGASGRYLKYFASVQAARLDTSLEIELSDGRGCLQGKPGDWCVWYGPEDASIVRSDVFVRTYELARVPVYVSLATHLAPEERSEARAARSTHRLRGQHALAPHGPLGRLSQALPAGPGLRDHLRRGEGLHARAQGRRAGGGCGKKNGHLRQGAHFQPWLAPRPGLEPGTCGLTEDVSGQTRSVVRRLPPTKSITWPTLNVTERHGATTSDRLFTDKITDKPVLRTPC